MAVECLCTGSGFGAAISVGFARSSMALAAAACAILLSLAAESRKSYWSGIKVVMVICQQLFLHFGADDFRFKFIFKKCFKFVLFLFRFWSCNFCVKGSLCKRCSGCKSFCVLKKLLCV